ncbi:MAG TPA: methionyl-tRNA formyltransferase [Candidatus Polarisedimenticolia bacterium]|nr:methionyl-tRNA formyltransferase [Candidatus Polarisedimenticolia bacterium]
MKLVFMGTPDFAVPSLRSLLRAGHTVQAVVTQPDRPRRRQSSPPEPSPVKQEALRSGLPVLQPESPRDPEFGERLRVIGPETAVVVAYGRILPPDVLAIPPRWCVNLHASLLPRYRGAAPIARAIMAGEKVTGVTTMRMDRGLDTGDILLVKECAIGLSETAGELTVRLATLGADLLVETLGLHARGALDPRRQDARDATQAPPLARADGRIDWRQWAQEIANRVRGCNPWPITATSLRGETLKILRAEVSFEPTAKRGGRVPPGRVVAADRGRILVQCRGESRLSLLEICFPGRRPISAQDALNGRLIRVGDAFAPPPAG